jgi:hypothetical protein
LAGAVATCAAGCTHAGHRTTGEPSEVAAPGPPSPGVAPNAIVEAAGQTAALSRAEAEARLPEAYTAFEASGSDESRLRVLLLTLQARADEGRDSRALRLLAQPPAAQFRSGEGRAGLEPFLQSMLEARLEEMRKSQRLDRELESALSQIGDLEARSRKERAKTKAIGASLREERQRIEELAARLAQEREKVAGLREQIENLKRIEALIDKRELPEKKEGDP